MAQPLDRAQIWWTAREVTQVFPTDTAVSTFVGWMKTYRMGCNRILDTLLGATYLASGITSLVIANSKDFHTFGVFRIIET
jgi:hypothetical protein